MRSPESDPTPPLDTLPDLSQEAKCIGQITGRLLEAQRHHTLEQSIDRFCTARAEGWPILFDGSALDDDCFYPGGSQKSAEPALFAQLGDSLTLQDDATAEECGPLVFENGWIMFPDARWFQDQQLVDIISDLVDRFQTYEANRSSLMDVLYHSDTRLSRPEPSPSRADSVWAFVPTGFTGYPDLVAAYASGYDARRGEETDGTSNGTTDSPHSESDPDDPPDEDASQVFAG